MSFKHPEKLYKILNESKYDLYFVKGNIVFATEIYVNEREWNFMGFFFTYTHLGVIHTTGKVLRRTHSSKLLKDMDF